MSEIKALEELRKYTLCDKDEIYTVYFEADELADEIQAEIDERFMELPIDADGVPWTLETESFVDDTGAKVVFSGLEVDYAGRWKIRSNCVLHDPSSCRHIKPDPLKELLREYGDWYKHTAGGCDEPGVTDEYADRIRELMKEGGE